MVEKFKEDIPRIRAYAPERWVMLRNYQISMLFEEVEPFSKLLQEKFPDGVFLSPESYGYNGKRYPNSVLTYPSPVVAGEAHNRPYAYFRVPWLEDSDLPTPIRLLGFYDTPDYADPSLFRRLGRRIEISWPSRGMQPTILGRMKRKITDQGFDLISSYLKISALFDSRDNDVIQFLGEIEQMLISLTTCDFASYDPYSGALINPNRRSSSNRFTTGVVRYAALHDRTYLGTCHKRGKPVEVMGVRPDLRAAIRIEAGLPVD